MRTALDADPDMLDEKEQRFVAKIREHGWFAIHVGADEEGPSFTYTTGFCLKFDHPELIVFSLPMQIALDTFWHLYRELDAGRRIPVGAPSSDIFMNAPAMLLPVSRRHYADHLGWSRWFYGGDRFECLQLIYTDRDGCFPWSPVASAQFRTAQPDLTESHWSGMAH
uniref:DUF4262 domain-containing protein n=1 Tax=Bradyrhizobium sp. (strain ORS 278) TaxID=114615 RepID=UPI00031D38E2|nr:DUF4262 domain-containing protein [Bradyrhizobium sp. ORS 278]